MDFREAENRYFEMRGRLDAGALSPEQFRDLVAQLRLQDESGRYWTIDARTGGWLLYDGTKWAPAHPAGFVSARTPSPPPALATGSRGPSPIFLIGALAVAALLCLAALGGAGVILGRLGGEDAGEGPVAVSRGRAERIADDLIAKEFPEMTGAEKTVGSFQNLAGTRFWTVTYRQDAQAELEGATYRIPNVVIVSVDQETGEPVVAVSG